MRALWSAGFDTVSGRFVKRTSTRCSACLVLYSVFFPHSTSAHLSCMRWMLNKYIYIKKKNTYCVTFVRFFAQSFYFQLRSLQSTLFTHRRRINLKRFKAFTFRNVQNVIRTERVKRNWLRWVSSRVERWHGILNGALSAYQQPPAIQCQRQKLRWCATSFTRIWQKLWKRR